MSSLDDAASLIAAHLKRRSSSWSIGMLGAVAEFFRAQDEPFGTDGKTWIATGRGAIRIDFGAGARAVLGEAPGPRSIALCLPEAAYALSRRAVSTEVGPDHDAVRADDRAGILFDLGIASPFFEFYIRTADAVAIRRLRRGVGLRLLDPAHGVIPDILALAPHRGFVSRLGRIEVYQPIAEPGGRTPEGPHTHLLPELLARGRVHEESAAIPPGWIPCAMIYPDAPPADGHEATAPHPH
jgi:hypothetical protein